MSEKHPYPEHIVEALADAAFPHDLDSIDRANHALQALWDASRIDTVSQAEELPDDVRAITPKGAYMAPWSLNADDLPAHVIDWGESDA